MALAPWRARRPGVVRHEREPPSEEELASCPFCEGREDQTPPETFALGPPGREPDTPGWSVRVVPNKYPAFEHHEVVIHTPRHVRSFADLSGTELEAVAETWHWRAEEAWVKGSSEIQIVINEGRAAGASLPHSHSQLVWLPEPAPLVAAEATVLKEDECLLCKTVQRERREQTRIVAEQGPLVALAPFASRTPYELLILGEHWGGQSGEDGGVFLAGALRLLRDTLLRLRGLEGDVPFNAWLHNSGHWHFEVVPRTTNFAGLELGAGIYINSLAPEEAARRLRGFKPDGDANVVRNP